MTKPNPILFHSLAARHATLAIDLDIVREIGFDGLEVSAAKMQAFLDAGFSTEDLRKIVDGIYLPGMGFLIDVERQGKAKDALMREAASMFELAAASGVKAVQVITGPLSLQALDDASAAAMPGLYRGVVGLPLKTQIELTAANLASIADLASAHGLLIYLEALSWTPLNTIAKQVRMIEAANRDNIRLVIDFWHCYTSGDNPEQIARLDKNLLYGVHICDSLAFAGGVPDESVLRNVPTGGGVLNLKEWVDAVKATGYDGWWSCELFCRRQHQENSYDVARGLKALMQDLVGA
ncbi:sugar phosphate isomerase/epimerase [Mesorhizobium sp. B2-4-15]|nr:sugar phosphate isomerase/epimerase [Mesorhizobium sp. B2-4-15]